LRISILKGKKEKKEEKRGCDYTLVPAIPTATERKTTNPPKKRPDSGHGRKKRKKGKNRDALAVRQTTLRGKGKRGRNFLGNLPRQCRK